MHKTLKKSKLRVLLIFSSGRIHPCISTAINTHLCYFALIIATEEYLHITFTTNKIGKDEQKTAMNSSLPYVSVVQRSNYGKIVQKASLNLNQFHYLQLLDCTVYNT